MLSLVLQLLPKHNLFYLMQSFSDCAVGLNSSILNASCYLEYTFNTHSEDNP